MNKEKTVFFCVVACLFVAVLCVGAIILKLESMPKAVPISFEELVSLVNTFN